VILEPEGWQGVKRILVILAHPDDPEFFCGATLARWCAAGHEVHYCLLTKGQKGAQDLSQSAEELAKLRVKEQQAVADLLGVKSVSFMDYVDGELFPDLEMRKKIIRVIRTIKPDILVTSDPLNLFPTDNRINHPDHRAAGQAVIDAAFPGAGNPMFFPELVSEEGLAPHSVEEIWLSATAAPNLLIDVIDTFEKKLDAIHCHASQMQWDHNEFDQMMRSRITVDPHTGEKTYEERFKRLKFN
jgi:LmbE family N-acetylglucosaminyl deacetylase